MTARPRTDGGGPRRSILVVDDEDDVRAVLAMTLEVLGGWTVRTAADGADAVRQVRAERPDAILLDGQMPRGDGAWTVRQLRADELTADIPVVLLTAAPDGTQVRELPRGSVHGVLAKPFSPRRLVADLDEALAQQGRAAS